MSYRESAGFSARPGHWTALAIVWILSLFYLFKFVSRGWIPHDEGCLSHMAERVLMGEIPHRDFDEIYSGGLTYLHAFSFKVAGTSLVSMRYLLLMFTLLWIPTVYAIARRFVSPGVSAAVAFLALVWSVPNYFASLPSWYNLFFATFGTLCLFRHIEDGRERWVFLAGLCGGLSFLVKAVGIYYLAATLLFLLYRAGWRSFLEDEDRRSAGPLIVNASACIALAGSLAYLLRNTLRAIEIVYFVVPTMTVAGYLLTARGGRNGKAGTWWRELLRSVLPLLAGVAVPVCVFLLPYVLAGAVGDLTRGLFVLPQLRLREASKEAPRLSTLIFGLPYALFVLFPFRRIRPGRERIAAVAVLALLAAILIATTDAEIYYRVWHSARTLSVVAVVGICVVGRRFIDSRQLHWDTGQKLYLLGCMTAFVALVQHPFGGSIYYCYVAPLVLLTLVALVASSPGAPRLLHGCALGFYLAFAVLRTNREYVWDLGLRFAPYETAGRLDLDRGGLRIPKADERTYDQLVRLVLQHSGGPYVYATPDSPEVYFLTGRKNPTRDIYEFFGSGLSRWEGVPELLERNGVRVITINERPAFSRVLDPQVRARLASRYPNWVRVDRFEVRWRDE